MGSEPKLPLPRDDEDRLRGDPAPGAKLSGKDAVTVAMVLGYVLAAYIGLQMVVGWL